VTKIISRGDKEEFTMISVTEFAKRMGISKGTSRDWIRTGVLKPGRHFIKVQRIYLIQWSSALLNELKQNTL
jgi:excisionase family DNA binding protein